LNLLFSRFLSVGDSFVAKIYIKTYGCTLNQADSDILRALILESGCNQLVDSEEKSDVIVLNTCTVKGATDNKILAKIKQLHDSGKKFVVAGCLTVNEAKIRKIAPNTPILGTSALVHINEAIEDSLASQPTFYQNSPKDSKENLPKILGPCPIARIPINEGCVSNCAYCQTKLARPFLRSYTPKTIVKWMNLAVQGGAKEIQLTSMDLGAYGLDIKTDLAKLLKTILEDNSPDGLNKPEQKNQISKLNLDQNNIVRSSLFFTPFVIRLGMINPDHAKRMLSTILEAMDSGKFYHFLHVPVQSGSEKVCREMNRDHTVKDFIEIVAAIRKKFPDATIATDIIVGYPTETEEDFNKTISLLKTIKPDIINISAFSPRPGTKAKELKPLSSVEMKRRTGIISKLVKQITADQKKKYVGRTFRVLITEKNPKKGDFTGRTIDYCQVVVKGFGENSGKLGDFITVKITKANHGSLFGVPTG